MLMESGAIVPGKFKSYHRYQGAADHSGPIPGDPSDQEGAGPDGDAPGQGPVCISRG